jgi:cytochrome c biogenesis protein
MVRSGATDCPGAPGRPGGRTGGRDQPNGPGGPPATGGGPARGDAARGGRAVIRAAAERAWHVLVSMRVALLVILALAALALVGTILVQAPASAVSDPEAKADWLATIQPRYGALTPVLDQLQLFTVFGSVWFRALAAYLAISLGACIVHRSVRLWHTSIRPTVRPGREFFERAPRHAALDAPGGEDEALDAVRRALRARRYRTVVEDDGAIHLYADRNRWGPVGSLAGHLGLLFILGGAVVGSTFGFSETGFVIAENASAPVPTRAGLSLELEAFRDAYHPTTGAPSDFASDVVLYQDGTEVARKTIKVNDPLRYDGISFYQADYGPAAVIRVDGASGTAILRARVPLPYAVEGNRRLGSFDLPEAGLTAVVVGTAGSGDTVVRPGQVRLLLYDAGGDTTPVAIATLDQGTTTAVAGLAFTFERESQYVDMKIASDPGVPLVWLGCILLAAGFSVGLLLPHRRTWARLAARPTGGTRITIASTGSDGAGGEAEFGGLVDAIRRALDTRGRG